MLGNIVVCSGSVCFLSFLPQIAEFPYTHCYFGGHFHHVHFTHLVALLYMAVASGGGGGGVQSANEASKVLEQRLVQNQFAVGKPIELWVCPWQIYSSKKERKTTSKKETQNHIQKKKRKTTYWWHWEDNFNCSMVGPRISKEVSSSS